MIHLEPDAPSFRRDHSAFLCTRMSHTLLLQVASSTVFNSKIPSKKERVKIVFGSGSQISYITDRVKDKLQIKPEGKREISIHTFGSSREKRQSCEIVIY